jgi:hypothetical protein
MRRNFILTQSILLNSIILLALFVVGGAAQISGLISITKTNLMIFAGIIFLLFVAANKLYPLGSKNYVLPLSFLCIYILINAFFHDSPILYCIVYIYLLLMIPMAAALFAEKLLGKNQNCFEFTKYFFYALAILQIPILFFQTVFSGTIANIASQNSLNIFSIDMQYGSFFIKSDYTLTLFMNILFANTLWRFKKKKLIHFLFILILFLAIFMTESKMGIIVFFITTFIYLVERVLKFNRFSPVFLIVVTIGIVALLIVIIDFKTIFSSLVYEMQKIEYRSFKGGAIPRYGVLLLLLSSKISFWGHGLFDYYNYFSMNWKFYAGHSLWLSIYNDIGIVGVALTIWWFWGIIHPSLKKSAEGISYFLILILYSFISSLLSDLGAMIIVFFFLYTYPRMSSLSQSKNQAIVLNQGIYIR